VIANCYFSIKDVLDSEIKMSETLIEVLHEATVDTFGIWVSAGSRIKRIMEQTCTSMTFAASSAAANATANATASAAAYTQRVRRKLRNLRTKVRRVIRDNTRTLVAGFAFDMRALERLLAGGDFVGTTRRNVLPRVLMIEDGTVLGRRSVRDDSDGDAIGEARASSRRRIEI
jgi:hypothetical protein